MRFELGRGCVACGIVGCDRNPERRRDGPERAGAGLPGFDRAAAAVAFSSLRIQACERPEGPTGTGHAGITFLPTGAVAEASLDGGPFVDTAVGQCIVAKLHTMRVPAFAGAPVRIGKSFTLQ